MSIRVYREINESFDALGAMGAEVVRYTDPTTRNVKRFRGGLMYKAHRLLYPSTLGLRVIKKKK